MNAEAALRALVVDDDVLIRRATVRALVQEGLVCDVASDGVQALEQIRLKEFDVVISDLCMPEMNGHRLVVEIQAMESPPAIVVLTGLPQPKIVRDLLTRGVEDVVTKPASYEVLALRTKAVAQRRRSERQAKLVESESDNLRLLRKEKQLVAAKVGEVRQAMAAPPAAFDAFRTASSNAFSTEDLAAVIQVMPNAAKEVLSLANSVVFRASEECRRLERLRAEHRTAAFTPQSLAVAAATFAVGLALGIAGGLLRGL